MDEERDGNKARLEASLTWLRELETLKRRQESLVLGALALGCPGRGYAAPGSSPVRQEPLTPRRHPDRLQGASSLLMLALQQQFSELKVDSGFECEQNTDEDPDSPSASSSGFYEQSESLSPPPRSCSSPNLTPASYHRPRSVDAYMLDWESHMEPKVHATLTRSFSAPYPPLEGIAEGIEEEEEDEDEECPQWVANQIADGNESLTPEMSLTSDAEADPTVKIDDGPTEEDIQQAMRVETYILGLLERRHLRATAGLNSEPNQWQLFETYPPQLPLGQSEWQEWTTFSEEEREGESQDGYFINLPGDQIGPTSLSSEELESSLEMEQYGVEEVYTSSNDSPRHQPVYIERHPVRSEAMKPHVHTCCNHTCVPMSSTPNSQELHQPLSSQNWALPQSLTRRISEERWTTFRERHIRSATRSRSEDSCISQEWVVQPEHKYYTVGRDVGRHSSDEFYPSSSRLWCSSADLSQEEDEGLFREEVHKLTQGHLPLKPTGGQFGEQVQDRMMSTPADGSDSSLSETFSQGSSSLSSDSDESGGLVWPQQLPPRLPPSSSSSSQNPSNDVVKIKASHALKKKIMRFRSGSLKLMTTV